MQIERLFILSSVFVKSLQFAKNLCHSLRTFSRNSVMYLVKEKIYLSVFFMNVCLSSLWTHLFSHPAHFSINRIRQTTRLSYGVSMGIHYLETIFWRRTVEKPLLYFGVSSFLLVCLLYIYCVPFFHVTASHILSQTYRYLAIYTISHPLYTCTQTPTLRQKLNFVLRIFCCCFIKLCLLLLLLFDSIG